MSNEIYERLKKIFIKENIKIKTTDFNPNMFGSWFVEIKTYPVKRIVYDGKESVLVIQKKVSNGWQDITIVEDLVLSQLKDVDIVEYIQGK